MIEQVEQQLEKKCSTGKTGKTQKECDNNNKVMEDHVEQQKDSLKQGIIPPVNLIQQQEQQITKFTVQQVEGSRLMDISNKKKISLQVF
ncbi:unnamed protein product [Paramecium sonneborni]|uniref:Uncharacterized protein n=1 Tax=Paramecium sonneborni TaxID=65129 RepID=A0A8S1KGB7_9CILI|nr:unnamed protein product [Paramecium sonneborni]